MKVRPATVDDVEDWVRVERAVAPYLVLSPESVAASLRSPRRLGHAVATHDGRLVGVGRLGDRTDADTVSLKIQVHPEHRRHGAGRALLDWGCRVDAATLTGIVEAESLVVAEHWGFTTGRRHTLSAVDPRTVPTPVVPPGVEVASLTTVGPRPIWECYQVTALDDPSGLSRPEPYADFLVDDWHGPLHRPDLGRAVLVADRVAAFSFVNAVDDRAWNAFTGTHPDQRGHGHATLAKQAALVALAAVGITSCGTGNDAGNEPMLAVNRRLGYLSVATTYSVSRALR